MREVTTQWWSMPLPDEWQAEHDDDVVLVSDIDGVGVLEISAMKKDGGRVGRAELNGFAEDLLQQGLSPRQVSPGDFTGLLFEYEAEGEWCRDWFLASQDLFVLVSYTCMLEDKGLDDAAVDQLVSFIQPL